MIDYYFHDGTSQKGPFSFEEILLQPIKPNTAIWREGESVWKEAKDISEFEDFLKTVNSKTPPPFIPTPVVKEETSKDSIQHQITPKQPSKLGLVGRVFRFLLKASIASVAIVLIFDSVIIGGQQSIFNQLMRNTSNNSGGSYLSNKLSVDQYEKANPTEFLTAAGSAKETIFGRNIKIKGTVTNKATVANFKDVTIEVTYYSRTKSVIKQDNFMLYDFVPAHTTKTFDWKISPPNGTDKINWRVVNAVPY